MSEPRAKENQISSELESPIWSVISFNRCEGSQLTYGEAVAKTAELESMGISGLCIVTDEAASRVAN